MMLRMIEVMINALIYGFVFGITIYFVILIFGRGRNKKGIEVSQ
jgi:hypothetical protein